MSITTYDALKTAVADFLNRDDLASVVPTFISLAEADISRKLRHWMQERKVRAPFDEGFEFLPDDWLATISLRHADGTEVRQVGVSEMAEMKAYARTGKPEVYRVEAGRIEVYPTPSEANDIDLVYFARIPALSATATTNWLLTNHPDILLYGSLMQSAPYLADDARVAVWGGLYAAALQSAQADSDDARHSGPLRIRIKV